MLMHWKKYIPAALLVVQGLLPATALAFFNACPENFASGKPPAIQSTTNERLRDLCFEGFAVLHSGQRKTPVFAAEKLTPERIAQALFVKRKDNFYEEGRLPFADRARLEDYKGSGFDRGHMAAAGNMPSTQSKAQSFSLANIVPQAHDHNTGVWADVEVATRKYVERTEHTVFVLTGPLYIGTVGTIGNGVAVPSHIFKLVYDQTDDRGWVFVSENKDSAPYPERISIQAFKDMTGIDWLPGLSPGIYTEKRKASTSGGK